MARSMIIVCLDQVAISWLARSAADLGSAGSLVGEKLLQGVSESKLLCPIAKETIVETTGIKRKWQKVLRLTTWYRTKVL